MDNENILISIILRTKNRSFLFKRAIADILRQTYSFWEIVVVYSDYPEYLDKVIAEYEDLLRNRIQFVESKSVCGLSALINRGIADAKGDYIVLHDDDDTWSPDYLLCLSRNLNYYRQITPSVHGILCNYYLKYEEFQGNYSKTLHLAPVELPKNTRYASVYHFAQWENQSLVSFMFTKESWELVGGVNENLKALADWDYLIKHIAKFDIVLLPNFYVFKSIREKSLYPIRNTCYLTIDFEKNTEKNIMINGLTRNNALSYTVIIILITSFKDSTLLSNDFSRFHNQFPNINDYLGMLSSDIKSLGDLNLKISHIIKDIHEHCKSILHFVNRLREVGRKIIFWKKGI